MWTYQRVARGGGSECDQRGRRVRKMAKFTKVTYGWSLTLSLFCKILDNRSQYFLIPCNKWTRCLSNPPGEFPIASTAKHGAFWGCWAVSFLEFAKRGPTTCTVIGLFFVVVVLSWISCTVQEIQVEQCINKYRTSSPPNVHTVVCR